MNEPSNRADIEKMYKVNISSQGQNKSRNLKKILSQQILKRYFEYFGDNLFSSVAQSCPTLCNPMNCNTPGFHVLYCLPEFGQIHVHWVNDAIQPSHPLSYPFPPSFNLSQHQGLFKWVSPSHQVAKVLEFQLQHQSFQWIFRTDFL